METPHNSKRNATPNLPAPSLTPDEALPILEAKLLDIPSLRDRASYDAQHRIWDDSTKAIIEKAFGRASDEVGRFIRIRYIDHSRRWGDTAQMRAERDLVEYENGMLRAQALLTELIVDLKRQVARLPPAPSFPSGHLVDGARLDQIRALKPVGFDVARLVRLCEELDTCYGAGAYHAVMMVTRAILDHVPPLFGQPSFAQVASNLPGQKSFKEAMEHLEKGARKIADAHLHGPIRATETLPNATQVNFSQYLDVLLAEIVRRHK